MIKITDAIYGDFEIDAVFEELVLSDSFQRLKKIHQGGGIFLVNPKICHTRFEHSLGVFFLVRQLGGSIKEQIAALLHDLSHTAFSHVTDYLFENKGENYHEMLFEKVLKQSNVPSILNKYGFDIHFLKEDIFTLLELPLPELCADRLDYTLRDMYFARYISKEDIQFFLTHLTTSNEKIVVTSIQAADWIRQLYKDLNEQYFRKPQHVYANIKLAELLKYGIQHEIIHEDDLLTDDFNILQKLSHDHYCHSALKDIQQLKGLQEFAASQLTDPFKKRELRPTVIE